MISFTIDIVTLLQLHFLKQLSSNYFSLFSFDMISGESANAVPHYQKLCSRDSHIWGIRRGQHNRSAMAEPRPG